MDYKREPAQPTQQFVCVFFLQRKLAAAITSKTKHTHYSVLVYLLKQFCNIVYILSIKLK